MKTISNEKTCKHEAVKLVILYFSISVVGGGDAVAYPRKKSGGKIDRFGQIWLNLGEIWQN